MSQDANSKHCGNKGQDALQTSVPNFVKNYASLSKSKTELRKSMPNKASSLQLSTFGTVTPSPKKRSHSKVFNEPRGPVVNVKNFSIRSIDDIYENYFDSTEMHKLFCPSEGESVLKSIKRRISMLNEIIENEEGINKYVQHSEEHPLTTQQVLSLTTMCTALRASYYSALNCKELESCNTGGVGTFM